MNVRINVLPEVKLSEVQLTHLRIARVVANGLKVFPARIHNSVEIIGAYRLNRGPIYIVPQRLERLNTTMNTCIHELAHHETQAADGTIAHDEAVARITVQVAKNAEEGKYDSLLKNALW